MAYFPLFVDLEGRQVLVVGGGKIAVRRVRTLLEFGCQITVVSPEVCEELREMVLWKKKRYDETDLESLGNVGEASRFIFVLAAAAPEVNEKIVCDCRKKKIPVNNASNRDQCGFLFSGNRERRRYGCRNNFRRGRPGWRRRSLRRYGKY